MNVKRQLVTKKPYRKFTRSTLVPTLPPELTPPDPLTLYGPSILHEFERSLSWCRYQIAPDWPYKEARKMFQAPEITAAEQIPEFKWVAPDEEVRLRARMQ